ncbi:hypothetical protein K1T71_006847 [Dendrolimus kikuchii]|uniref:Uncharacterized protein n=1 Tax=Dendrolimus kikuchii TaxID=765133 RepID=A0ACC1D1Y3_9NEOP|nr:hypothetical protein K1T71_006847 [Dendrolimus kikuchii]
MNCTSVFETGFINYGNLTPNNFEPNKSNVNLLNSNVLKEPKAGNSNTANPIKIPISFNWIEHGAVTPAKDQRKCNACWAFTVIASIESHLLIHRNQKEILSEQFLLDCLTRRKGCDSDSIQKTYADIVTDYGGVIRESDYYPYTAKREECRWPKYSNNTEPSGRVPPGVIPVVGFRKVRQNEDEMAKHLYGDGPLAAAINSASMKHYRGNYIDEPTEAECDPKHLDHTVLIVGYNAYVDTKTGHEIQYWIIKNSWGESFGYNGYYNLVRGRNACGITSDVSFPVVN